MKGTWTKGGAAAATAAPAGRGVMGKVEKADVGLAARRTGVGSNSGCLRTGGGVVVVVVVIPEGAEGGEEVVVGL